jgi:serine/threonine protein kinase
MCYRDFFLTGKRNERKIVSIYYEVIGKDLIECYPLPIEKMIEITYSLLTSLSIIHSLGIVHRDIKPENIIYHSSAPPAERVILIDFDYSCSVKTDACIFSPGTIAYAASSVFKKPIVGKLWKRCDIVSAALTIYRLVFNNYDDKIDDLIRKEKKVLRNPSESNRNRLRKFLYPLFRADLDYRVSLEEIINEFYSQFQEFISPKIKKDYESQMKYYRSEK